MGEHLAEIYEKQQKKKAAVHTYKLALAAASPYPGAGAFNQGINEHLEKLGASDQASESYPNAEERDELSRMRSVKLPKIGPDNASAEVFVVIGPGAKIEDVKFLKGPETFSSAKEKLTSTVTNQVFPDNGPTRIIRRGMLGCFSLTGCTLAFMPLVAVRSVN